MRLREADYSDQEREPDVGDLQRDSTVMLHPARWTLGVAAFGQHLGYNIL